MDNDKIKKMVQDEVRRQMSSSRFGMQNVPFHTHNGIDSPNIKADNVIPSVSVSGRITFAQATDYTLNLNSSFTPNHISLYGVAYDSRTIYTFTLTAAKSVSAGAVYRQGALLFTVVSTVTTSTTVQMYGSSAPSSTGRLTRVTGSGNTPLDYTSYSTSSAPSTRAILVGSANLGPSFYFQPGSTTSVVTGNIQYPFVDPNIDGGTVVPLQSSMYFLATNSSTTYRGQPGEGHIVDVQYSGNIYARATVTEFSRSKIVFNVSNLSSGWEIYANIVIT